MRNGNRGRTQRLIHQACANGAVTLLFAVFILLSGRATAATYYVDATGGLDSNAGTSPAAPWKTLWKVSNFSAAYRPGDSILLKRGQTWNEEFIIVNQWGVAGNPITYGAYGSGNLPVIDAQKTRNFGFWINNVSYITVKDIKTVNAIYYGVDLLAGNGNIIGVTIQGVTAEACGRCGFYLEASVDPANPTHVDAIEYRDCLANLTGGAHAPTVYCAGFMAYHVSDMPTGVHYYNCKAMYSGQAPTMGHGFSSYYANNIHWHGVEAAFTNIDPATGQSNGYTGEGAGIQFDDFVNNSSIENSYSHDNLGTGIVISHQGTNNTATYNICRNNQGNGMVVNGGPGGSTNTQIFGNTIYGNGSYGITVWSLANGVYIKNNIIANNTGYGIGFSASNVTNTVVANNVIFGHSFGATAYVSGATGTIISDPKFTNPAGFDFTLQSTSPARDAGLNLGTTYQFGLAPSGVWTSPVSTLNQNSYGPWEIGAYVYFANQAPVVVSSAWANPNPVTLPSNTSVGVVASDPDGGPSALTYTWSKVSGPGTVSFTPNGTTTSDISTAGFSVAGSYVLRARISDGATSVTSDVTVTVNPVSTNAMHVARIDLTLTAGPGGTRASATVFIVDQAGVAVPGAAVTGSWSGLVSGSASGTTGANGSVSLTSPKTKKAGTFSFTVLGVSKSGYSYDAGSNVETSDSITK